FGGGVNADAIPAGGFRCVERFVGGFQESAGVTGAGGDHRGDADADRDYVGGWGRSVFDPHVFDRSAQQFGELAGAIALDPGNEAGELLAAVAGHDSAGAMKV